MDTAINLEAQPNSVNNFGKPDKNSIVPLDAINDLCAVGNMQLGDLDGSSIDEPTIDQSLIGPQGDR